MTYSFTGSGTSIIVTADTESGNFTIDNQSYSGASAIIANDRIYLREYGMDKQNFAFHEISTIDSVAPTDLEDAFEKLLLLIANFNGGGTAPYKVYTALLTQSGTNAPTATVLENTLGDVVWIRDYEGGYSATSNDLFTFNKTFVMLTSTGNSYDSDTNFVVPSDDFTINNISIGTQVAGVITDGQLELTPIEIRVYN